MMPFAFASSRGFHWIFTRFTWFTKFTDWFFFGFNWAQIDQTQFVLCRIRNFALNFTFIIIYYFELNTTLFNHNYLCWVDFRKTWFQVLNWFNFISAQFCSNTIICVELCRFPNTILRRNLFFEHFCLENDLFKLTDFCQGAPNNVQENIL